MVASLQNQNVVRRNKVQHNAIKNNILHFNRFSFTPSSSFGKTSKSREKKSLKPSDINKALLKGIMGLSLFMIISGLWLELNSERDAVVLPETLLELPKDIIASEYLKDYTLESLYQDSQTKGEVIVPDSRIFSTLDTETYTVQYGDSISVIASDYNVNMGTLISFNGIENVNRLQVGTVLNIPNMNGVLYRIQRGDNLSLIANDFGVSLNNILDVNDLASSVIYPGQQLFIPEASISNFELQKALGTLFLYPTSGRITSGFGYRNDPFTGARFYHNGVDIANNINTPVKAAMDGTIIDSGVNSIYGNYIVIRHLNGYQTLYGHLNRVQVTKGQFVSQSQQIGLMGSTGRSTGSHLHFTIFLNQEPVNPLNYLN